MQTIQLHGNESPAAILDLLQRADEAEVLLFVPRGCEALERNQVNLRLLRRWADNLALQLGLVIEDRATQVLAHEAGLLLFPSIEAGQGANLRNLDRRRRRRRDLPPRPTPSLLFTSKPGAESGRRLRGAPRAALALIVSFFGFFVLLALSLAILPSATVRLVPLSEPVQGSLQMTAVAGLGDIDYGSAQIPASNVSVEREGFDTISTTNKRDVPDGHAEGTVIVANKTSIPVTITQGTVLRTSYGQNVRFYTISDAFLPGELFSTVSVRVLAAEPGPSGNVPALTINVVEGEFAAQVDVLNSNPTKGGTVRRISTVDGVDKVNLRAKLLKSLQEEAYRELTGALGSDDFIPADSLTIAVLQEEFDHKIDDVADELALSMTVKVSGLAASGAHARELISSLMEQQMPQGYRLLAESVTLQRGDVLSASGEDATFEMSASGAMAQAIDQADVARAIAGASVPGATSYLVSRYDLAEPPAIRVTGSLLQRLPWWTARIGVHVTTPD